MSARTACSTDKRADTMSVDSRVRVFFRPRPPDDGVESDIVVRGNTVSLRGGTSAYEFAGALQAASTQQDAHAMLCGDMMQAVKEGVDAAFLFYGQTGTGKTHTATGTEDDEGVVLRALSDLMAARLEEPRVVMTAFEIGADAAGRERITDLIRPGTELPSVYMPSGARAEVRPLETVHVSSLHEARCVVSHASRGRSMRKTAYNEQSSRSHAVTCVHVRHGVGRVRESVVYFLDLAGAERHDATDSDVGHREAISTNSALTALGRVIQAMASGSTKPPFRDSLLTRVLAGPFTGGVVRIMVHGRNGYPAATAATLNFGQSALSIRTRPVQRERVEDLADLSALLTREEQRRIAAEERLAAIEKVLEQREAKRAAEAGAPVAAVPEQSESLACDSSESSDFGPPVAYHPTSELQMRQLIDYVERFNAERYNTANLLTRLESELEAAIAERDAAAAQTERALDALRKKKDEIIARVTADNDALRNERDRLVTQLLGQKKK